MKPNDGITTNVRRLSILIGSLALALNGIRAQETPAPQPTPATESPATAAAPTAATPAEEEDIVTLSPFVVDASKDVGYYAENTLAGSRMATKVADLGASITVVTMQQMEDTASTDINDVFRYEANTEGSSTYTPAVQSLRNDGVVDVNAGFTQGGSGTPQTNATANRVRGLGIPDASQNYYPAISAVPMDAYNVQSVEISRGPNSMLFGMGSAAGIVNQSSSQAALDRDSLSVGVRTDSNGSMRGNISFNKSIIEGKLALFGAALYDDRAFEREPSYDDTRRMYGALTFKPFSKTTLRASIEDFHNENSRPNTLTPRDSITQWRSAGSPTYDPTTGQITRNGQNAGVIAMRAGATTRINQTRAYIQSLPNYNAALWNSAQTQYNGVNIFGASALTDTRSALYTPGLGLITTSRPLQQVDQGELANWFYPQVERYRQVYGTASDPAANAPVYPAAEATIFADPLNAAAYETSWTSSNFYTATGNGVGQYRYPGVTDKSIYNWEKINTLSMNFGEADNTTLNVEFEQQLLDNLTVAAGWFYQDYTSLSNYTVSQLNVSTLFVDTNVRLPDGRANPYFGLPYMTDFDPDQFVNERTNDNVRAMVAYTPDFTRNDGWTRWLGRHQLLGVFSRQLDKTTLIRQRMFVTDSDEAEDGMIFWTANPNNRADGSPTGWSYQNRGAQRLYYLASPGDATNGGVTRASGRYRNAKSATGEIQVWNFDSRSWQNMGITHEYIDMDASTGAAKREVDSLSFGLTSHLWKDRLVTTFGFRNDDYQARNTSNGVLLEYAGGPQIAAAMTNPEKWVNGVYQTKTVLNRWNYWDKLSGDTSTYGAVLRPFMGWGSIERKAQDGSQFWQFVNSFGVSYNKSDNFNPPLSAQVDAFGNSLPKPTGEGEDYGFQFSLFDNKLFARFNWFKASNLYERTANSVAFSRFRDQVDRDQFRNWARTIVLINMGQDPTDTDTFGVGLTPDQEQSVQDATAEIWGQSYNYYGDVGNIASTRSAVAEGMEVQVTYNPTRNWSIKATFGEQETVYSDVLREYDAWKEVRTAVWDDAQATDFLLPQYQSLATYTRDNGREVNLTNFWDSYGYTTAVFLGEVNGNESVRTYFDNIVTPNELSDKDLEGQAAPGQRKYRGSLLSNYSFQDGALRGTGVGGSMRWEDKAIIGYYGKPNPATASSDLVLSDTTRPIYDSANTYFDLWVSYSTKIFDDKVRLKVQLNIENVMESGDLRVVGVNLDGSPNSYRIIDPRRFILSAKFDF